MKPSIHPAYYPDCRVTCACGNSFTIGSTKQSLTVEVCSKCHPFYTGEHRFLDVKGRVDTFQKKQEIAKKYKSSIAQYKKHKGQKEVKQTKTLRELLNES